MKLIFLIIAVCMCISLKAQRYLPKQQGLQITIGTVDGYGLIKNKDVAYHIGIARSGYTANANRWLIGVEYLEKYYCYKTCPIPMSQFTAEAGYYYNFLSTRKKDVFFSIGAFAIGGYEVSNWGEKKMQDGATLMNEDCFIGGGAISFEIETFVTDRVIILLNIRERILFGSSVGEYHTQVGIGVKYIIR